MSNKLVAACVAAGILAVGALQADAGERFPRGAKNATTNATMISNKSNAPQSRTADGARYERKCVIMSCGTPWCYNTRIN